MQANYSPPSPVWRNLGYFFVFPLIAVVLLSLATAVLVSSYQSRHVDRIYTGVTVSGIDLSEMTRGEAEQALATAVPYVGEEAIVITDPVSQQKWVRTPADLGVSFDVENTLETAFSVGREGSATEQYRAIFDSWYYGRSIAPVIIIDEGKVDTTLNELVAEINQTAVEPQVIHDGETLSYTAGQIGYQLDTASAREQLLTPINSFRPAQIELPVQVQQPTIQDDPTVAANIEQIASGPVTFYLTNPLDELDLEPITLSKELVQSWLRVAVNEVDGAAQHTLLIDENAARQWLTQYSNAIYREPTNARFYFDDDTRELVLVSPHVNGRSLDIDATASQITAELSQGNRSIPLIVQDIVPAVHSEVTAAELGITELVSEKTTWFDGSTDARKRNIARGAANFFGIVIAPGEEFSFNKYLGTISEDDGYTEGLIIVGGRTITGIGGGICQVSTTMFQTAFWAGFPITERWAHGYMLQYYNDGEGPGMDATVFSPIVDFRFINNTPHHLLIENYYSEANQALTIKMYSTSMGRVVEKSEPIFENVVPAPEEDVWEFNEDLAPGTVNRIDYATEGATVTINRTVYNAEGEVLIDEDFVSQYIPWADAFHYGPDVDAPDYSLVDP